MKKLIAVLLSALCFQAFAQQPASSNADPRFDGLDSTFQKVLDSWHGVGFAVAVVEKNKVIYAKGFGYRDMEHKLPVTPNTLFAIGSCTKAFTATLIGKLQKDGKLDIDKPASTYMPSLKFYNDALTNSITLRDMMSHRTGLPRHDQSWYFFNSSSMDSLVQRIQYMEPTYPLRQKWQYNNMMFMAQGALVEKMTGKSWADNVRQNFFVPLGMTRTVTDIPAMEKSDDYSFGYEVKKGGRLKKMAYYNIEGMAPAGAINSSVNDMAKWVMSWINDGKYEGKEIIPSDYRWDAINSQQVVWGNPPSAKSPDIFFLNYGFGWFLSSYRGHYQVDHDGNLDGFSATTAFFPSDNIGIIVLTNQDKSSIPLIVRNLLADRVLGLKYRDWNGNILRDFMGEQSDNKKAELAKKSAPHNPATHPMADYTGSFQNPAYGTFKIYSQNDSLFAKTPTLTLWLRHNNYDIFDLILKDPKEGIDTTDGLGARFQYQMNLAGEIDGFNTQLEPGLKPLLFNKIPEIKNLTAAELQKYTGSYSLGNTTSKVYIKDNKTLFVSIPNEGDFELTPLGNDKFAVKVMNGFSVQFTPQGASKITGADYNTPNGSFKVARK